MTLKDWGLVRVVLTKTIKKNYSTVCVVFDFQIFSRPKFCFVKIFSKLLSTICTQVVDIKRAREGKCPPGVIESVNSRQK